MAFGPTEIIALLIGAGILAAAAVVLATAPSRFENQLLAMILFLQGFGPAGVLYAVTEAGLGPAWFRAAAETIFTSIILMFHFLYLWFVGIAIRHPSTDWIRKPLVGPALAATAITVFIWQVSEGGHRLVAETSWLFVLQFAVGAFALVAATLSMRATAVGSISRRRARTYLLSFAANDVGLIVLPIITIIEISGTPVPQWPYTVFRSFFLFSAVLVTVALLRGQVLAMDHKIARGTGVTIALAGLGALFVVAAELIEDRVGGADSFVSLLVAIALAAVFSPLHRWLTSLLLRRMPNAKPIAAMSHDERIDTYREQVELARGDGVIDAKEQRMLESMALRLGLSAAEQRRTEAVG